MLRDEIVAYLERYAASFKAPVREGVEVASIAGGNGDGFTVETSAGGLHGRFLVVATGAYQRPYRPPGTGSLPGQLLKIDIDGYRNPEALPAGDVLIIGSGQSGCQIAEELTEAGRKVALACGRAPWGPRRFGDHDLVWWLTESGFLEATIDSLPGPEARLFANILVSGHGNGRDLHLRTLRAMGVTLTGHFLGATDRIARFAPDLAASVAWGDERYQQVSGLVRAVAERDGLEVPKIEALDPFDPAAPTELDLADFGTVLFAGGFRPDFASWMPWPGPFDADGFPIQKDGASSEVDGLYFLGVHFLRKRKSSLLSGVGEDAGIVARAIAGR